LDGTVVLVDVINGAVIGKVETGREKAAEGEKGKLHSFLHVEETLS
jgi:hypothetical protein